MAAVRQPPTRRYWVMTASGHFLSVLLMAGAGSVLGAAIRSATDPALGGDPAVHAIRRRRMSNAMIRGVGSVAMWAPSSLMLGLLFVVLPELEWRDYVAYGLVTVVLMLAVGAAMDWVTRPRPIGAGTPVLTASPRELYAFVPLLLLVLLIFALSLLLRMVLPLAQLPAILSCALVVALGWIAVQDGVPGAVTRLRRRAVPLLVSLRSEVCILAAAGMIGPLVLTLQSADRIEGFIAWLHLSGAATLVLASWVIVLLGQIGISPIVSVSVLAEPLWHLSSFDFSGTELILALMIPTVVFAITSPLSVIVRASASAMQLPVESVGRAWNWAYGLVIMLCLSAALFIFV